MADAAFILFTAAFFAALATGARLAAGPMPGPVGTPTPVAAPTASDS